MTGSLFHIAEAAAWAGAGAEYVPAGYDGVGFVHLCTSDQLAATGARWFGPGARGPGEPAPELVLVELDGGALGPRVRWEEAHGELFPHLYGPVPRAAVVTVRPFAP